jgi:hypothetical protein
MRRVSLLLIALLFLAGGSPAESFLCPVLNGSCARAAAAPARACPRTARMPACPRLARAAREAGPAAMACPYLRAVAAAIDNPCRLRPAPPATAPEAPASVHPPRLVRVAWTADTAPPPVRRASAPRRISPRGSPPPESSPEAPRPPPVPTASPAR